MAPLIIMAAMFVILWALFIRPQRQRLREQQTMLASVESGDEVLTVGGLYGIVREIDEDDDLIVEVADGIRVRIARRAVATVVKPDDDDGTGDDEDATEGADADGDEVGAAGGSGGVEPDSDDVSTGRADG